jgi:hypothetical protein
VWQPEGSVETPTSHHLALALYEVPLGTYCPFILGTSCPTHSTLFFPFLAVLGVNLGPHTCQAGTPPLEIHPQT